VSGLRTISIVLLAVVSVAAADRVDPSTLDGKVLFGYQGWFDCPSDGGDRWSHWARGVPAAESLVIDLYPDLREFDPADLCPLPGMTIGDRPTYLFSAHNPRVVLGTSSGCGITGSMGFCCSAS